MGPTNSIHIWMSYYYSRLISIKCNIIYITEQFSGAFGFCIWKQWWILQFVESVAYFFHGHMVRELQMLQNLWFFFLHNVGKKRNQHKDPKKKSWFSPISLDLKSLIALILTSIFLQQNGIFFTTYWICGYVGRTSLFWKKVIAQTCL